VKKPTEEQWRQIGSVCIAAICIGLAVFVENRWVALANAFGAGINVGGMVYGIMIDRLKRAFDQVVANYNEMSELNKALIQDRVILHFDRNNPPPSPSDVRRTLN
jgi:hypothetical protein